MARKRLQFHEGAAADVKSATAWDQKQSHKAAMDFVEELHRAFETIADAPERWPLGRNNTRRFLLWRFPFTLIYSEQDSAIMVWAVAHASRRPGYWEDGL